MKKHDLVLDSTKLFFINVFMFVVFFELYVFLILIQGKLNNSMPFYVFFFLGLTSFLCVSVWLTIMHMWKKKFKTHGELFERVIISEIPFFALLVGLALTVYFSFSVVVLNVVFIFLWYLLLFPLVMHAAKKHITQLA